MKICMSCFNKYDDDYVVCPHCGAPEHVKPLEPIHLIPGTILQERYIVGQAVGSGGFGIVYKAYDAQLDKVIAIKEFFNSGIMTRAESSNEVIVNSEKKTEYKYRKQRFLSEAVNMAKFPNHKNIPYVFANFEENKTAYIAMELLEGESLKQRLKDKDNPLSIDESIHVINEVGKALISLHNEGIIHKDVAPDNVFLANDEDHRIKLLDFGAAKFQDETDEYIDIILKPGFSPVEQYNKVNSVGPYTDVYSLGATLYQLLTGIVPQESTNRAVKDELIPPHLVNKNVSEDLSNAVMRAMALNFHFRYQSIAEFLSAINDGKPVLSLDKVIKLKKRRRFYGLSIAMAVILVIGLIAGKYFYDSYRYEGIKPATITVWYGVDEGSNERIAMQKVVDDFMAKYPAITIVLEDFSNEEYNDVLLEAFQKGEMPNVYESSDAPEEIVNASIDLENVIGSEEFTSVTLLKQYDNYYKNHKKMPLGVSIPVAYIVTNGPVCTKYYQEYYTSVDDFGVVASQIAYDEKYTSLLESSYDLSEFTSKDMFMNNEENFACVLLSSSLELNNVRKTLTNYMKSYSFSKADKVYCEYVYEFSASEAPKKAQMDASELFISWLLSNTYQDCLMISECQDGQIPVNDECFMSKVQNSKYLKPLEGIYSHLTFKK